MVALPILDQPIADLLREVLHSIQLVRSRRGNDARLRFDGPQLFAIGRAIRDEAARCRALEHQATRGGKCPGADAAQDGRAPRLTLFHRIPGNELRLALARSLRLRLIVQRLGGPKLQPGVARHHLRFEVRGAHEDGTRLDGREVHQARLWIEGERMP